jgi:GT2 family glycosyltransferase
MVIDNRSSLPETARLLKKLTGDGVKVIEYPFKFNYSAMMNLAVAEARTEFILFLNNDVKLDEEFRFEHLEQHLKMPGVGAASTILVDEDLVPSHMGLKIGLKGIAASPSSILLNDDNGDRYRENHRCFVADASTFALTAVKRDHYLTIGGLDERFKVGLNDVDFCIRLSKLGYKTEICVQSASMHIGSATRGPQYIPHRAVRTLYEIFLILRKHDVYRIFGNSYLSSKKSAK